MKTQRSKRSIRPAGIMVFILLVTSVIYLVVSLVIHPVVWAHVWGALAGVVVCGAFVALAAQSLLNMVRHR